MRGIEKLSFGIDPGPEKHVARLGGDVLPGNQVGQHPDRLFVVLFQILCHDVAAERGLEQVERRNRNGEIKQFDLVKGIFKSGALQYGEPVFFYRFLQQHQIAAFWLEIDHEQARHDQQFVLGPTREAEGPDKNQGLDALYADGNPVDKVFQRAEIPRGFPLRCDGLRCFGFQAFQVLEAEIDIFFINGGLVAAFVYAGIVDLGPGHPGFVHVHFGTVEAPEIVDHCRHELQRVVGLQVEALVAFHGIGGRMRLAEGIARKGFDLPVDFLAQRQGVAFFPAAGKKVVLHPLQRFSGASLAAHGAAQYVSVRCRDACIVQGYLDHVFLVDHDAVGLAQLLPEDFVEIVEPVRVVVPENIFFHHPGLRHARADDGGGGHQDLKVVAFEPSEQSPHGRALDIEASDGLSLGQERVAQPLVLGDGRVAYVHIDALVFPDQLYAVVDVPDAALAQDVELVKADILRRVHVELNDRKALGRHFQCRKIGNRLFGDQDAAGMHAALVGIFLEHRAVSLYHLDHAVAVVRGHRVFRQGIELILGQPEDLADFAEDGAVLELDVGAAKGDMVPAVSAEDVFQHRVAFLPGPVDVEIGRRLAVQVQEALEIEVEFQGADVGYFQAVGNDGVGPAAAPDVQEAPAHAVAHDVPGNQEIAAESQFVDDLQLFCNPGFCLFIVRAVAQRQPFLRQPCEQAQVAASVLGKVLLVSRDAELVLEMALLYNVPGVL